MKRKMKALCGALLLTGMLSPAAHAATAYPSYTWDFTGPDNPSAPNTTESTNWRDFTSGSKTVRVRALYTGNDGATTEFRIRESATGPASGRDYARIHAYDKGLGIVNPVNTNETSSPNHATDNSDRDEFLLFDFGEVMDLQSFQIGYGSGDTDIDIWVGPNNASAFDFFDPTNGLTNGTTVSDLISAGFTKYNTFANVGVGNLVSTGSNLPGGGNSKGRYMLVSGALNSGNNDAFKFSALTLTATPTPGTIALLGIGLIAVAWSRRRGTSPSFKIWA